MNTNQFEETPQDFAARYSDPDEINKYITQNEEGITGQRDLLYSFEKTKLAFEDIQNSVDILSDSQTFQPIACLLEAYGYAALQRKVHARQIDQVESMILKLQASNLALTARLEELKSDG